MTLIVDAHADIAYNMLKYGRDYTRAAEETRRLEVGSATVLDNEDSLIGWPDYQRGQVAIIFSTLYATPARWHTGGNNLQVYKTFDEAHELYREQLLTYHRMTDSAPDKFRLVATSRDLDLILDHWQDPIPSKTGHPVGMVVLMEGAEGIRNPSELEEWYELGLRVIGPAWVGTRYCGGWKEPGPLTSDGRKLLSAMADYNFTLDLSHMDEQAAVEALDIYRGPIVGTHGNCLSLMPNTSSNRHFSDRTIEGIVERDGVVGIVPFNTYLKPGWLVAKNKREEVPLKYMVNHIDHICQIAGDALHVGIGSDFDGGFGLQSVPPEIDTVADLQNLVSLLAERGYSEMDVTNILGGNWITRLKRFAEMTTNQPFNINQDISMSAETDDHRAEDPSTPRIYVSIAVTLLGLLIFIVGAKPDWLGWDRSPVVGFVQIAVFLAGLAIICFGGYVGMLTLWWGRERTITSDIGTRLVATGYVFSVFAGLADIFGMGSQSFPQVPYFGPLQASGVLIGQGLIVLGFLLFIPYRSRKSSNKHEAKLVK